MGLATTPERSIAHEQLLARLSEENTAAALNRLLDRLEVITFVADALHTFLGRADVLAESVASSLGDLRKITSSGETAEVLEKLPKLARAGAHLADVTETPAFERLVQSGLVDKLGDPKTIESIKALIERLELAVFTLEALDGWLRRGEEIATSLAEGAADLREATPKFDPRQVRDVLAALPTLVNAGTTLVQSGMLEPKTVGVLGTIGRSAADAYDQATSQAEEPRKLGVFGLMRELKDPDVNRALDFLLRVAKAYGQRLK